MLTQFDVKELLYYDKHEGHFFWKKRDLSRFEHCDDPKHYCDIWNTKNSGNKAGYVNEDGYIIIGVNGRDYRAHRLAWLYINGYFPEHEVDHINRIRDDNRWENLRHVTRICNSRNASLSKRNTSGITGVYWVKRIKKWMASICVNNKQHFLGTYVDYDDAVRARWEAEKKYGWSNCNTTSTAYLYLKELRLSAKDNDRE